MNNKNKSIVYYYSNICFALIVMVSSFMYMKSGSNISEVVNLYNNNVLEVEQIGKSKLNYIDDKDYSSTTLNIYNNGKIKINYKLIYRLYNTNVDKNKLKLIINDKIYDYNNIIYNENDEYTDVLLYTNDIHINDTNSIKLSFVIDDDKKNQNIYISGNYIIESLNSHVVYK